MENKDGKNEELLNKQLQLLAEKSLNADADTLVSLTDSSNHGALSEPETAIDGLRGCLRERVHPADP